MSRDGPHRPDSPVVCPAPFDGHLFRFRAGACAGLLPASTLARSVDLPPERPGFPPSQEIRCPGPTRSLMWRFLGPPCELAVWWWPWI